MDAVSGQTRRAHNGTLGNMGQVDHFQCALTIRSQGDALVNGNILPSSKLDGGRAGTVAAAETGGLEFPLGAQEVPGGRWRTAPARGFLGLARNLDWSWDPGLFFPWIITGGGALVTWREMAVMEP